MSSLWYRSSRKISPADNRSINIYINTGKEMISSAFYISAAACPFCGKPMHKTVFWPGLEYAINTPDGNFGIKRVFTCRDCCYFVTSATQERITDTPAVYEKPCLQSEYSSLFSRLNAQGTTQGRPDSGLVRL